MRNATYTGWPWVLFQKGEGLLLYSDNSRTIQMSITIRYLLLLCVLACRPCRPSRSYPSQSNKSAGQPGHSARACIRSVTP